MFDEDYALRQAHPLYDIYCQDDDELDEDEEEDYN